MKQVTQRKREWVIHKEAGDKLFHWLSEDPSQAVERFEKIRQMLVRFFVLQNCSFADDLADDVIQRVARAVGHDDKIITCKPETFFWSVAENVWREELRRREKLTAIDDLPPDKTPEVPPPTEYEEIEAWEQEEYNDCLQEYLTSLPEIQRTSLLMYYQGEEEGEQKRNRKALAEQLGISVKALHSRMVRLREKLEISIRDCLKTRGKDIE